MAFAVRGRLRIKNAAFVAFEIDGNRWKPDGDEFLRNFGE